MSTTRKTTQSTQDTTSTPRHPPRRVVIKAGTNVLTGGGDRLDLEVLASLAGQVARLRQARQDVVVVTSGAVAAGRHVLGLSGEARGIPLRQTLAAVGQSRLMHAYEQVLGWHGITVAQVLITRHDVTDRLGYLNVRNTFSALLGLGVVPIVNENDVVGVEELTGEVIGDNDYLSALVASLADADLLVMLTDIGGLYTADPHLDPGAHLIPRVDRVDAAIEALAGQYHGRDSRGGMAAKLEATRLATAAGVAVVIADGRERNVVPRLARGEAIGTYFPPAASKVESRKRWMLGARSRKGEIQVDAGAAQALRRQHRSLLPAGIVAVRGPFSRGDIIPIVGPDGEQVACGIVNYAADDLDLIKGARSDRIVELLGSSYGEEAVHRDNLVLL